MDTGVGGGDGPHPLACGQELKVRQFLQLPPHKHFRAIPAAGARPREIKEKRKVEKAGYRSSWSPLYKKDKKKLDYYCLAHRYGKGNTLHADCVPHAESELFPPCSQ